MLIYIILIIVISTVLAYLSSPSFKGKMGERMVIKHAQTLGDQYVLLNDCTIPDQDDGTTQIDHILISPYGVFVIETKNYTGWIFGGARQKFWTQKIYKKSYKFKNPIHQNYKHMKVLENILFDVVDAKYLHSLIVFTPRSEFKTVMPSNIFRGKEWVNYVKSFQEEVIVPMKQKRIKYRIEKEILEPSWRTNYDHIQRLKDKSSNRSTTVH